jgi:hypothetical protein
MYADHAEQLKICNMFYAFCLVWFLLLGSGFSEQSSPVTVSPGDNPTARQPRSTCRLRYIMHRIIKHRWKTKTTCMLAWVAAHSRIGSRAQDTPAASCAAATDTRNTCMDVCRYGTLWGSYLDTLAARNIRNLQLRPAIASPGMLHHPSRLVHHRPLHQQVHARLTWRWVPAGKEHTRCTVACPASNKQQDSNVGSSEEVPQR